jgi:DHA1 family bicyclomycin/chloramphenicol resistance-like MFS transporter
MPGPRFATTVGSKLWIVTLAGLTAVVALSIDMSLPAQPTLAKIFDVSSETAQLTLSVFLLGFAAAQIFVGYLSDAWGRRRVILGGLALFSLAGIGCAASSSIEMLIAWRVVQGVGAAAAPVVCRAMVRDTQPAAQAARLLSTMLATLAIAPMVAPIFGGWLLHELGWRAIFVALAVTGAGMFAVAHVTLIETLPVERRNPPSLPGLFRSFARFFSTPGTRLPLLVSCAVFAGQFAYIADSPFVLMGGYGVSSDNFGFYFAWTALALMFGSLAGVRMLRAGRSPGAMIVLGTSVLVVGGILVVIGTSVDGLGIAGFMVPMIIYFFGAGMTSPNATALAMEPTPQIAGVASAAIGCSTMVSGSLAGYETTRIGGSSPATFALVVVAMAALALGLAVAAAILRSSKSRGIRT